jgi:outer membrane protein assembly factor BamD (BamD/ComL family)
MRKWLLLSAFFAFASLEAGYTLRGGKIVNTEELPTFSAEEHYSRACQAMNEEKWGDAASHFNIIAKNFSQAPFYHASKYYLGVCYFFAGEYDFANTALSDYLQSQSNPLFFEDAIAYKLQVANCFRHGAKRRFFGTKKLPRWASGRSLAVDIYNEVITALPCHEYAAQALYGKAHLLWEDQEFRECVDTFQTLIRRFPKHVLAPVCYGLINRAYLDQARCEFQNPDILVLAQINLRKFEKDFPKDERVAEAANDVQLIKEQYAQGLFETGQFYERIDRPEASVLYYQSAIEQFPDTSYAKCSKRRLSILQKQGQVESCAKAS